MVELTKAAKEQLDKYFADKEASPIRIYLASGGWAGPRLSLALDEPRDTDEVFELDGYKVVVEKELYAKAQPIKVDMTYMGFQVTSSMEMGGGGGGGCSSCSSCG